MTNLKLSSLLEQQHEPELRCNSTIYEIDGVKHRVPIWSHPGAVANYILNYIQHTHYFGIQVIAPPGHGKTTVAKIISHHLHKKYPDFEIRVEKEENTHAFERLDQYIRTLPKKPMIVIFDDLSGVFGSMSDEDIDKNFDTLTRVRWILDPATGLIPFIPILTYHYSKVIEKKFRSQNGMTIMCSFGNEEKTNIDSLAPKGTIARKIIHTFDGVFDTMFPQHKFTIFDDMGNPWPFETDKPFRASCVITGNRGTILVTSHKDLCEKCDVASKRKKINNYEELVAKVRRAHGKYGMQALRHGLAIRGEPLAINPKQFLAEQFTEREIFSSYDIENPKLLDAIYKDLKSPIPKKVNRKRKLESAIVKELDDIAYRDDSVSADIENPGELKLD